MLRRTRKHLSYANVMASIAIFAVLGGAAFAAVKLPKNSVKSKQIAANAVKTAEIAGGAVTTEKLGDNAATGTKIDESTLGQVPSAASADNATNATNAQNATNAANAANADALAGLLPGQYHPNAALASSGCCTDLPLTVMTPVLSTTVPVPAGGADVVVNGSVGVTTDDGAAAEVGCQVQTSPGGAVSRLMTADIPASAGFNVTIPLSGMANHVLLGGGDATVAVQCRTDAGDASFVEGNFTAVAIGDG
jgi:hypothetical protein